ncbi:Vacuolar protein sorting-associated protein 52, partial [Quaeritorhiza haematococci]
MPTPTTTATTSTSRNAHPPIFFENPDTLLARILAEPDPNELDNSRRDPGVQLSTGEIDFNTLSFDEVDGRISEFQEDALVKEAFEQGVDLREYAQQIERDLQHVGQAHVLDYVTHTPTFASLNTQLVSCDHILSNMEDLLTGFQADLGKISEEIEGLQRRGRGMSVRLGNRVSFQQALNVVLDGLVISPDLIKKICEGEVNDFFLQHLSDLNKKMTWVKNQTQQGKHIRALKDVGPELERLRLKAAEKTRDFLLKKLSTLSTPSTNISIIQQNILLKYKELYWFLVE